MEAKTPQDIYKAHLLDGRASSGAIVDSARQNLAALFVNAFVNAGFGQDKLMTGPPDLLEIGSSKTKNMARLVQQLVWVYDSWDVDSGLSQLDKYFHSNDKSYHCWSTSGSWDCYERF